MLDIDADGRIEALHRALAWSFGPSLIFVHVPVGPAREELLARLASWSGKDEVPEVRFVTLTAMEQPFRRLESLGLDPAKPVVVVLVGLEQYAMGDRVSPVLARLNFLRDLLPRVVPGPLVLVANDEFYLSLLASAPDTFTWRQFEISVRGVGEVEEKPAAAAPVIEVPNEDALAEVERLRGLLDGVLGRPHGQKEAADLRLRLGRALTRAYRHEEAESELRAARRIYEQAGSVLGEANCIGRLGDVALRRSDYYSARTRYEEALSLYRRFGNVLGEANCIKSLGDIALERTDHEGARAKYEDALPLYRRVSDVRGEANCISRLGDIAFTQSDLEGARKRYEEALLLHGRIGHVLGEANGIARLGEIALARSDYEGARVRYEEALPLHRRVGEVLGEANCIQRLGDIALAGGDRDGARARYEHALDLYERIREPFSIGRAHERLARLASTPEARRAHLDAAREAWTSIDRADLIATLGDLPT